jgi:hypothetical protein
MFVPLKPFQPSKPELPQVEDLSEAPFWGRILALPTNITLGFKAYQG